jgi:hypothetical protein
MINPFTEARPVKIINTTTGNERKFKTQKQAAFYLGVYCSTVGHALRRQAKNGKKSNITARNKEIFNIEFI